MLEFISAPEAAKKWDISERRVQNRIPGGAKFSRFWLIPKDAEKPADKRKRKENRK
ncbi:DNA-binding protein [Schaedlerella arabinosiphila]|uniref:DNA-binding protein n=1 Tax=Schaedlerella arabinosiphila TaxID=2044587 RepID=A0A3R8JMK6_9FIRM|nr:DNA-binding protein [Schaedlerella arabinosiphila]RRK31472.1 DNA-binding protein [Schaedlerella arabinosiphila]